MYSKEIIEDDKGPPENLSSDRRAEETQGSNAQAWKYTGLDGLEPAFDTPSMLSVEDLVNDADQSVASSFEFPPANFITPPTTYHTNNEINDYDENNQLYTANDTDPWGCNYAIGHDGHWLFPDSQLALGDQFAYQPHDQVSHTIDPLYYNEMPATSSRSRLLEDTVFASGNLPEAPPAIKVEDTSAMRLWLKDNYDAGDRKGDDGMPLHKQDFSATPDSSLKVPYRSAETQDDNQRESSVDTSHSETGLSCPNCSRAFENRDDLRRHRKYHDQRKHACHCGKRFIHPKDLRRHEKSHNPKDVVSRTKPHRTTVTPAGQPDDLRRHVMKKDPDSDLAWSMQMSPAQIKTEDSSTVKNRKLDEIPELSPTNLGEPYEPVDEVCTDHKMMNWGGFQSFQSQPPFTQQNHERHHWKTGASAQDYIHGMFNVRPEMHQWVSFELEWEVVEFLRDQLDGPESLRTLFVVTGTEDRAWASTCLDYMERTWPETGSTAIDSLISFLSSLESSRGHKASTYDFRFSPDFEMRASHDNLARKMRFFGYGTGKSIACAVQQLTWLAAICRIPRHECLSPSKVSIQPHGPENSFSVKTEPLQQLEKVKGSCWHDMFVGYVLAYGFPIPSRDLGLGVEMPFETMTILALVCYPINYGAGIVLKGDCTALVPSKEMAGSDSVQWHFIRSPDGSTPLSWEIICRSCKAEDVFETTQWEDLKGKRAFVGYFPKSEVHLGTDGSGFNRIETSSASIDDKMRFNIGSELSGTFGTSGLGIFGASITGKTTFHRLSEQRIRAAHGMFWDKLRNSRRQPLLLYDVKSKRGWLVPELSAILHISLAWASIQEKPSVLQAFTLANVSSDGGMASYTAIETAMENALPSILDEDDFDKEIKVRDIIKCIVNRIGQIKEQQQQLSHCAGTMSGGITGYEFLDIARLTENLIAKRAPVDENKTGDWLKIVEKWPEMAVVLCGNLGEPIRLARDIPACNQWARVPEDNYVMTATAMCLKNISEKTGGDSDLKVYNELYCVRSLGGHASEHCLMNAWPCCSPLFEIKSTKPRGPLSICDEAALIFGNARRLKPRRDNAMIELKPMEAKRRSFGRIESNENSSRQLLSSNANMGMCKDSAPKPTLKVSSLDAKVLPLLPAVDYDTVPITKARQSLPSHLTSKELFESATLSLTRKGLRDLPSPPLHEPDDLNNSHCSEDSEIPHNLLEQSGHFLSLQMNGEAKGNSCNWGEPSSESDVPIFAVNGRNLGPNRR